MDQSLIAHWLQCGAINAAMEELLKSKKKNNGRVCKNGYSEAFQTLKEMGVNIGIDALYKQVEREYTKWVNEVQCDVVVENDGKSEVSDLTGLMSYENNHKENDNCTEPPKKCGRPKGCTIEKKHNDRENVKDCLTSITKDYAAVTHCKTPEKVGSNYMAGESDSKEEERLWHSTQLCYLHQHNSRKGPKEEP